MSGPGKVDQAPPQAARNTLCQLLAGSLVHFVNDRCEIFRRHDVPVWPTRLHSTCGGAIACPRSPLLTFPSGRNSCAAQSLWNRTAYTELQARARVRRQLGTKSFFGLALCTTAVFTDGRVLASSSHLCGRSRGPRGRLTGSSNPFIPTTRPVRP